MAGAKKVPAKTLTAVLAPAPELEPEVEAETQPEPEVLVLSVTDEPEPVPVILASTLPLSEITIGSKFLYQNKLYRKKRLIDGEFYCLALKDVGQGGQEEDPTDRVILRPSTPIIPS